MPIPIFFGGGGEGAGLGIGLFLVCQNQEAGAVGSPLFCSRHFEIEVPLVEQGAAKSYSFFSHDILLPIKRLGLHPNSKM